MIKQHKIRDNPLLLTLRLTLCPQNILSELYFHMFEVLTRQTHEQYPAASVELSTSECGGCDGGTSFKVPPHV